MTPATSAQAITPSAPPPGEEVPAYVLELELAAAYLPAEQLPLLRQAWRVGAAAHAGQTRKSGEPYITHPVAVAIAWAEVAGVMATRDYATPWPR